ncbi:MAG: choice-of-anchor J domain-containing protein [bacterium]
MKVAVLSVLLALTFAGAEGAMLQESFDGTAFPPEMWTVHNADAGANTWLRSGSQVRTAPACAAVKSESKTLRSDDWLVTRRVMPLPGANQLEFWCRSLNRPKAESLELWLSTAGPEPDEFSVLLAGYQFNNREYASRTVSLAAFDSVPVYVGFRYRSLGQLRLHLDDISGIGYVPADVGIAGLLVPRAYERPDTTVTPAARVKNYGAAVQSGFGVDFFIISVPGGDTVYRSSATTGAVEPQEEILVSAPAGWHTALGQYRFVARTALAGDMEPRNDERAREFRVVAGEIHDVALNAIIEPSGMIPAGPVVPRVEVENLGTATELFPVLFVVRAGANPVYTDTVLADVPAGQLQEIEFPSWDALPGSYTLQALTLLPGDMNPLNDTQLGQVEVVAMQRDVGLQALLAPLDTVFEGDTVTPVAVVANYGDYDETFTTWLMVGAGYSDTLRLTLAVGEEDTLRFRPWHAAGPGSFAVTAFTTLAGDVDPSNDTARAEVWVEPYTGLAGPTHDALARGARTITGGEVVMRYSAPAGSPVVLSVYSPDGRLVAQRETAAGDGPGCIAWNRLDNAGRRVAAGVYLFRLDTVVGRTRVKLLLL